MEQPNLLERLREKLAVHMKNEKRSLAFIAETSNIEYFRLWRFHNGRYDLTLLDADKLHIFLTGKTFINTDHV